MKNSERYKEFKCIFCDNIEVDRYDAWNKTFTWKNLPLFSRIGKTDICIFCLKNLKHSLDELLIEDKEVKLKNQEHEEEETNQSQNGEKSLANNIS